MSSTAHITDECIREGKRDACFFCPVALAIRPLVKPETAVMVGVSYVRLGALPVIQLPPAVTAWIARFDQEGFGLPFEFELEIPEEVRA